MNVTEIRGRWEQYKQRVEELHGRAINGDLANVNRELGGLVLHGEPGMTEFALRCQFSFRVMHAIAEKVIPNEWTYEVQTSMVGTPQLVLLRYTQRYLGSRP